MGTGKPITRVPTEQHILPINWPIVVSGDISPWLFQGRGSVLVFPKGEGVGY